MDDLFGLEESREQQGGILSLSIDSPLDFEHDPFKIVVDDESMLELTESIKENGVLTPLEVRPHPNKPEGYEVIAGHRRKYAAKFAEKVGESRNQIQRYIRLTYLSKPLLELVDSKKIPFNVGVSLLYP